MGEREENELLDSNSLEYGVESWTCSLGSALDFCVQVCLWTFYLR